ncbi:MAG: aminotransferase class V-fold PLP-dependent enzyme [Alphaproteobacteria bacterium]|nr:aminotransferase class V-fold PLP-dependent enzyme [Alphaproteobacteria bacterium]
MPALPDHGLPQDALFEKLTRFSAFDAPWRSGKTFAYMYDAGPEVDAVAKRAYTQYLSENGLDPTAFPSLMMLENELVGIAAKHLNAPEGAAGSFTSGGTESCMLSVKTARDHARAMKPHITAPEIVLPVTAHAAFHKAAHYMGLKKVLVPVNEADHRVRPEAIEAAITPNTVLIVASATNYSHGTLDPIEAIGKIAAERNILFHVDGCIGAWLLPFFKRLGAPLPAFDFTVPGVTSMSMDWHKYAYCPKGASVVLYRTKALRQFQLFACAEYTGYTLINTTILSSKSAGPLAAAWAVLNFLGDEGYMRFAKRIYEATQKIVAGIEATPGLRLLARPDTCLIAFTSDEFPVFHVIDEMKKKDWLLQAQFGAMGSTENVHLSVGQSNFEQVDEFLKDLKEAVAAARAIPRSNVVAEVKAEVAKLSPAEASPQALAHLMDVAGVSGGKLPERMADLNQILGALPPKLAEMALTQFFNDMYTAKR